jgi:chlorobactene glucosyltransferase
VYDDDSTDDTAPVVSSFCANDKRFRLISGIPLPMGWLGKPHACHRLAGEAVGDYFLFLDADVSVSPSMLGQAVAYASENDLSLLSVFPQQQMHSPGERIMVPLMNWILLSLLPMILIRKTRNPSLAAANGQFMLFRAKDYRAMSWHARFKTEAVEDIKISRALKNAGFRMATLLGNEDVYCRMYRSYGEALHGFAKNSIQFFGGSRLAMLLFAGLVLPGGLIIFLYGDGFHILFYCIDIIFMRVFISLASRQPIMGNLLLHPLQMISFGVLTLRAIYFSFFGRYVWKGRDIRVIE